MSSSRANAVSEINLEEFERRLRAASTPQNQVEDPLAELTRLVDTIAAERPYSEKVIDFTATKLPKAERFEPPAPQAVKAEAPKPVIARPEPPRQRLPEPAPEPAAPPAAELRGRIEEPPVEYPEPEAVMDSEPDFAAGEPGFQTRSPAPAPARSSSWYLKVGGLTALGLVMVAGAATMKLGVPGMPKKPPLILAAETPVKVAPPQESSVQSSNDSGTMMAKEPSTPAPVKLISHEEQPVDLNAHAPVAKDAAAAPAPIAAPTISPVAPTADTPVVPLATGSDNSAAPPMSATPKRVKTVSVRPDGTLISSDLAPIAPAPAMAAPAVAPPVAAVKKPDTPAAAPLAATPTVDLPPKPPTPKSSARVAIAKTDTTVPADSAATEPLQLGPAAHAEKPAKLPTKLRPQQPAADAAAEAPKTVAEAAPDAAPPAPVATGGDWSVQLAAPRSEADAQSAITRLNGKYGDALGGAALGVHKADVNGSTIYRVRAGGMSKSEAAALCAKLKAAGGDCFVAKN